MKIVVIGATGYLGSAISAALAGAGHHVVRTGRNPVPDTGEGAVHAVDLADPASLHRVVTSDVDAVVHAGAPLGDWSADADVVADLLGRLREDAAFVYVSGAWVLGPSSTPLDEQAPPRPIAIVKGREEVEELVLESPGRGIVIRPGIVHGAGAGIPALMTAWAAESGHGRYVAAGGDVPTWASVHVDDLADLAVLAVTGARAGDVLHGVAEEAVPLHEVAEAADLAAGGTGVAGPWPLDEAAATLGPDFAGALGTGQHLVSRRAAELGWAPRRPGLVSDLRDGSYAARATAGA
jgi:nucleoside-diphosphate-sugar epimerase